MARLRLMKTQAERVLVSRHYNPHGKPKKKKSIAKEIRSAHTLMLYKRALGEAGKWCRQNYNLMLIDKMTPEMAHEYLLMRRDDGIGQKQLDIERSAMEFVAGDLERVETDQEPEVTSGVDDLEQAFCSSCEGMCRQTDGKEIYPHRPDLSDHCFYVCDKCATRVGCHPGTAIPLGMAVGKDTRHARMLLHQRMFDPLWENRKDAASKSEARDDVYSYLAHSLDIPKWECHIGRFSLERCRAAWVALRGQTPEAIAAWNAEQKRRRSESVEESTTAIVRNVPS